MTQTTDTRTQILDIAERLLQQRGFNAFSYQDIANELGIRKASLHYHFPSKADLGTALAERHANRALDALQGVDQLNLNAWQQLDAFFKPFIDLAKSCDLMCVGGVMASEYSTLPTPMQHRMDEFFAILHTWLTRVLRQGRASGQLYFGAEPSVKADAIIATLEGAILIAKTRKNADFIDPLIDDIKASLGG
ncbi:TetR/AcrR family transcriptional regulator [Magnetovibrio sp.]|uniref:TetR/AcrR family transcriptional regulator n=1 Tax=Magnetovibrio sp. TaxID=2024836 RepID=UPI002F951B33